MVSAVSEHTSTMSKEIDVPIICIDDDHLKIDKEYKLFLDHLSNGNDFGTPFEDDNGESETRNLKLDMFSKRSKPGYEKPINNRVSQQRKRKSSVGFEAEISRAFPLATTRESIQRDNRVAERRKRKIAELEAAKVSRAVPLVRSQQNIQPDNKDGKTSEPEVETLWDVPLVRTMEDTQRAKKARKTSEPEVETLWDVPLAITIEDIQRDNKARKMSESKVETLWDVPLFRTVEDIQRDNKARKMSVSKVETLRTASLARAEEDIQRVNRARKMSESKVETLWDVPLVVAKEVILGDKRIAERRKKKTDETNAAGTSRVVPAGRIHRVTEPRAVDETSRFVPVTQMSNKGVFVGTRKKNGEENEAVVDKDYMSYLAWLVDSHKNPTAEPEPSDFDPPILEARKESTISPEKDLLVKVKVEQQHLESWSDDDDIIAVSDTPFSDGEGTPFVVSKSRGVIDLEEESTEDESSNSCFKKKLMDVLKKPYDKGELLKLSREASITKRVTRCRELRKGRESNYQTDELGLSYLEKVSDFDKEYKRVDGDDKARLELLRGFFFYLENVSQVGAFKPWLPENQNKLRG